MISKELLSEVLGKEVTNIQKGCTENELKITAYFGDARQSFHINIYELAYKCKEWAYENDYYIYSIVTFAAEGSCYLTHENNISKRLKTFDSDTEQEAILKACEYILNNIKQ